MSLDEALQRSVDSALPGDGVSGALLFKFTPKALSPLASSWFLLAVTGTFPPCWTALSHPVGCMLCQRVQRPLLDLGGATDSICLPWTWLPKLTPWWSAPHSADTGPNPTPQHGASRPNPIGKDATGLAWSAGVTQFAMQSCHWIIIIQWIYTGVIIPIVW